MAGAQGVEHLTVLLVSVRSARLECQLGTPTLHERGYEALEGFASATLLPVGSWPVANDDHGPDRQLGDLADDRVVPSWPVAVPVHLPLPGQQEVAHRLGELAHVGYGEDDGAHQVDIADRFTGSLLDRPPSWPAA